MNPFHIYPNGENGCYLLVPIDKAIAIRDALRNAHFEVACDEAEYSCDESGYCFRLDLPSTTDKIKLRAFLLELAKSSAMERTESA